MKAVVYDRYGPPEVLRCEEVERPVPGDDELLVRVHATTVNRTDCHRRGADPFLWRLLLGLRRPKQRVLGMEFAGVVEAVGSDVGDFAVGDEVFGLKGFGAHAELVCIPVGKFVAHKPANVTFEQAAAVPDGGVNALTCLRGAGVGPGMHVVVYGASGSIGTAAVQLARQMGARVTAVCMRNFALAPISRLGKRRVTLPIARARKDDFLFLKRLLEDGEYRAVIDRSYPLADIVAASRYVETQEKTGNVALTIGGDGP